MDRVDLRVAIQVFRVGLADAGHEDPLAVGAPLGIVVIELAVGDLPRRAADDGVHREDLGEALLDRAGAVARPRDPIDDRGRLRPFGAARALRQLDLQRRLLVGQRLREGELLAVRRPAQAGRGALQVRELRDLAGVHIQHVHLVGAVTIRQERDRASNPATTPARCRANCRASARGLVASTRVSLGAAPFDSLGAGPPSTSASQRFVRNWSFIWSIHSRAKTTWRPSGEMFVADTGFHVHERVAIEDFGLLLRSRRDTQREHDNNAHAFLILILPSNLEVATT